MYCCTCVEGGARVYYEHPSFAVWMSSTLIWKMHHSPTKPSPAMQCFECDDILKICDESISVQNCYRRLIYNNSYVCGSGRLSVLFIFPFTQHSRQTLVLSHNMQTLKSFTGVWWGVSLKLTDPLHKQRTCFPYGVAINSLKWVESVSGGGTFVISMSSDIWTEEKEGGKERREEGEGGEGGGEREEWKGIGAKREREGKW